MTTTQRPSLMPSTMHHIFIGGPSQITLQWPYAVRVDLVTSWSPGRKKRRATSWLLRGRQVGLTQVDKVR